MAATTASTTRWISSDPLHLPFTALVYYMSLFLLFNTNMNTVSASFSCPVLSVKSISTAADRLALVYDLGGFSTRMHVFSIDGSGDDTVVAPLILSTEASNEAGQPLVSIVELGRHDYYSYITCLEAIGESLIPSKLQASTTVFIFGTGGVRQLDEGAQGEFVEVARNIFSSSPFIVLPHNIDVLEGSLEVGIPHGIQTYVADDVYRIDCFLLSFLCLTGNLHLGGSKH
eukprot:m.55736 g.55736  ORF g.55736 m.55736 type:complete len:229 (-) comp12966_c1_seq2:1901-2587(-)